MDVTFSLVSEPKRTKWGLWVYYQFVNGLSPYRICLVILFFLGVILEGTLSGKTLTIVTGICGLGIPVGLSLGFFTLWRQMKQLLILEKAFEIPATLHLTDDYFEMERGENRSRRYYNQISSFFLKDDTAILLMGNMLAGVFARRSFPDQFDEFLGHLKRNGAVNRTPRGIRLGTLILTAITIAFYIYLFHRVLALFACN